jgi:hypothetical protein
MIHSAGKHPPTRPHRHPERRRAADSRMPSQRILPVAADRSAVAWLRLRRRVVGLDGLAGERGSAPRGN